MTTTRFFRHQLLAASLALVLAPSTGHATEPGPYVFFKAGFATSGAINKDANDAVLAAQGNSNTTSKAEHVYNPLGIGIGYRLSPNFGVEASYLPASDFEGYSANFTPGAAPWTNGRIKKNWRMTVTTISAVGTLPVHEIVSLIARASMNAISTRLTNKTHLEQIVGGTVVASSDVEATSTSSERVPSVAIGIDFGATDAVRIRFEYEAFGKLGSGLSSEDQISGLRLFSAAVAYHF